MKRNHFTEFDWRKSEAHLLLLTKFIFATPFSNFSGSDYWESALGESPAIAIARFQSEGLLTEPTLEQKLSSGFGLAELKRKLKDYGLKQSGRKPELAARLVEFDADEMQRMDSGLNFSVCSVAGAEISSQINARNEQLRNSVEQNSLNFLENSNFIDACLAVAQYEASRPFPRGVNIDWKNYDPAQDIKILEEIFSGNPKILARFNSGQIEKLRVPAGMKALWGELKYKWLSQDLINIDRNLDLDDPLVMDVDTAVSMLCFHAKHQTNMAHYRSLGFVNTFKILSSPDSCETCKKLSANIYGLDDVPDLPHECCTHDAGCRCEALPVIE